MNFKEWMENIPEESEIGPMIEYNKERAAFHQNQVMFLSQIMMMGRGSKLVLGERGAEPIVPAPPQNNATPEPRRRGRKKKCFGDLELFQPEGNTACEGCGWFDECATTVAESLGEGQGTVVSDE